MIGFYDYTVVVTYISLISSIIGIFMAIEGRMQLAVFLPGLFRSVRYVRWQDRQNQKEPYRR